MCGLGPRVLPVPYFLKEEGEGGEELTDVEPPVLAGSVERGA